MIFLGLVIAAAAVGVGVGVVLDNKGTADLAFLDHSVPGVNSTWQVFVVGAFVAIVFMAGMIVAVAGVSRSVRVRRELRDLRDEHETSLSTLEMEKRNLQRELARARREQAATPGRGSGVPEPRSGQVGGAVASSTFFDPSG